MIIPVAILAITIFIYFNWVIQKRKNKRNERIENIKKKVEEIVNIIKEEKKDI
jgi:Mg2+/citrate symporter